jgi:hypothetical protein
MLARLRELIVRHLIAIAALCLVTMSDAKAEGPVFPVSPKYSSEKADKARMRTSRSVHGQQGNQEQCVTGVAAQQRHSSAGSRGLVLCQRCCWKTLSGGKFGAFSRHLELSQDGACAEEQSGSIIMTC